MAEARECHVLEGHSDTVLSIEVSKCQSRLFCGCQNNQIIVWNLKTFEREGCLCGHKRPVNCLLSYGDNHLLSASADGSLYVWNIHTKQLAATCTLDFGQIFSIMMFPLKDAETGEDNNQLLICTQTRCVLGLPLKDLESVMTNNSGFEDSPTVMNPDNAVVVARHQGYVHDAVQTTLPQGRSGLVTAGSDRVLRVWATAPISFQKQCERAPRVADRDAFAFEATLEGHEGAVLTVVTSDNNIFSGSSDHTIRVWDKEVLFCKRTLRGHEAAVTSLRMDGMLFSGSLDETIGVWDPKSFDRLLSLRSSPVMCVRSFSHPLSSTSSVSSRIVTGHGDQRARIFDVHSDVGDADDGDPTQVQRVAKRRRKSFSKEQLESISESEMIATLSSFVAIRSVSGADPCEDCWAAAKFVKDLITSIGAEARFLQGKEGRNPLVFGEIKAGKDKPTVTIYGHYDVVAACGEWTSDPFKLTGRNGYLYGRGASDNKGPIVATIFAIKELLASGNSPVNIKLLYEGEEECGSIGCPEAIQANKELFQDTSVILICNTYWINNDRPCLIYGMRGVVHLTVSVEGGEDLHSGLDGGSVQEPMADLVRDGLDHLNEDVAPLNSEEEQLYETLEQSFDFSEYSKGLGVSRLAHENNRDLLLARWREPSLTIHKITGHGSHARTSAVIPKAVTSYLSVRTVPNQSNKSVIASIQSFLEKEFDALDSPNKLTVGTRHTGDWWLGDPSSSVFQAASNAIQRVWGVKPLFTREGGTIPITRVLETELGAPAIHLPLGQASDQAHLADERFRIQNFVKGRDVIREFLSQLTQDHRPTEKS